MARENKIMSVGQAVSHVRSGDRVMVGGFGGDQGSFGGRDPSGGMGGGFGGRGRG